MAEMILEMRSITKAFPGVKALDNVNLQVRKGEIHAIVGENGAGKSTLMNVLSGVYPYGSYEGDIVFQGRVAAFRNIRESERAGITIIHQELALSPYMSIAENVFLGNELAKHGVIDSYEAIRRTRALMKSVDLEESPDELVMNIGVGKQQLVEICKALSKKVELLILDEPTAALNDRESQKLLDLLLQFKEQGITSIIITHKLKEVTYVADTVTVIRDGSNIERIDVKAEGISEDRIIKSMVGRDLSNRFPVRQTRPGEIFFEVAHWNAYHPLQAERKICDDISLQIRRGEAVGIAGLMGAGRTEFAMSLFGRSYGRDISGTVKKDGKELHLRSPSDAIAAGIAYVTEDRKQYGLVLIDDIRENTTMAAIDKVSRHGIVNAFQEIQEAEKLRKQLKIKSPDIFRTVSTLSGGNQQKVVLAKWLMTEPDLLILDEPTRGIDVGAKYEIYLVINEMVKSGKGVLMISSEMEELLGMCDRIYVLNEGRICGELDREAASQEAIMKCIVS